MIRVDTVAPKLPTKGPQWRKWRLSGPKGPWIWKTLKKMKVWWMKKCKRRRNLRRPRQPRNCWSFTPWWSWTRKNFWRIICSSSRSRRSTKGDSWCSWWRRISSTPSRSSNITKSVTDLTQPKTPSPTLAATRTHPWWGINLQGGAKSPSRLPSSSRRGSPATVSSPPTLTRAI